MGAASNLKSQYQDEAILGFNKMLGRNWVAGAKVTLRKLHTSIDDVCDPDALEATVIKTGIDPDTVSNTYGATLFQVTLRYRRFSVTYDL